MKCEIRVARRLPSKPPLPLGGTLNESGLAPSGTLTKPCKVPPMVTREAA
jgi:hypothetical protein